MLRTGPIGTPTPAPQPTAPTRQQFMPQGQQPPRMPPGLANRPGGMATPGMQQRKQAMMAQMLRNRGALQPQQMGQFMQNGMNQPQPPVGGVMPAPGPTLSPTTMPTRMPPQTGPTRY